MAQAIRDIVGDVLEQLTGLRPGQLGLLMRHLSKKHRRELVERWQGWAQPGQCEPPGDWRIWMIRAGRGFGKTRAGAEWISEWARMMPGARIALVAANDADGLRVMIEGPSGLLAVARSDETPRWIGGRRELHFESGAVATLYSAAAAENLRGPEHHVAWCDELAKWPKGDAAWDNLMMGLRLGLADEAARDDVSDLRQLLGAWRDAKKSVWAAAIDWATRGMLALIVVGLAVKLGLPGLLK